MLRLPEPDDDVLNYIKMLQFFVPSKPSPLCVASFRLEPNLIFTLLLIIT
jgi:hypothetical protein